MEKLYEWVRQIAYVMVLISVIMQLAAGKQYQKYIRLYTGIGFDSFYACSGVSDIWNRYDRIHD